MRTFNQSNGFTPVIQNTPPLPPIDWSLIGQEAPVLLNTPPDTLPQAQVVIITWSLSEWAAMQQVFCNSSESMPYTDQNNDYWSGWQVYDQNLPPYSGSDPWTFWCYTRLVQIQGQNVLLIKSNTHLGWPGPGYLEQFIYLLIVNVQPQLILSIGTAGGAQIDDHTGTVYTVPAATMYTPPDPPQDWPLYSNSWLANWSLLSNPYFNNLLFPVPTTESDLEAMSVQFNQYYGTDYSLEVLNPGNLDFGDVLPQLYNLTPEGTSLLTTSTFIVGNTDGNYSQFACIEMDDAIVGMVCQIENVPFGFVRNLSDPVQNAVLPTDVQSNWGNALYEAYGFYTSYNGALLAWAIVCAQLSSCLDSRERERQ